MYCVYLTEYFGDKMPPKYIGSSSVQKVNGGYKGSVSSKEFSAIWKQELKNHPELFSTTILSEHPDRKSALIAELNYQIEHDVVSNAEYINKSYSRVNGYFGMDVSGKNNPMYGKIRTGEKHNGGNNISKSLCGFYKTDSGKLKREKMSDLMFGKNNPMYGKKHSEHTRKQMSENRLNENNPMYGKKHSERSKEKMRLSKLGENNPACKMRKKYVVNGIVVENAKKFCEENNLAYTRFITLADKNTTYKGFIIKRIAK